MADAWQPDHHAELKRLNVSSYAEGGMPIVALPAGHLIAGYPKIINKGYAAIRKQAQDWLDEHYMSAGQFMIEDQFMYRRDNSCTARCNYPCSSPDLFPCHPDRGNVCD